MVFISTKIFKHDLRSHVISKTLIMFFFLENVQVKNTINKLQLKIQPDMLILLVFLVFFFIFLQHIHIVCDEKFKKKTSLYAK